GPQGEPGERGERGEPGEKGERGADGVEGPIGRDGPPGRRGVAGERGERGEQGPKGEQGPPGQGEKGDKGERGLQGERGEPGLVTVIKEWKPGSVSYAAQLYLHKGSTWQAIADTAIEPGHGSSDAWQLVAAAGAAGQDGTDGKPGAPGRDLEIRGTYDTGETYRALDVVTLNGSWFVALRDAPGVCPGNGWRVGPSGRKGDRGEPGEAGPTIRAWHIDATRYTATPIMSNGIEGPKLELRTLFQRFHDEAAR